MIKKSLCGMLSACLLFGCITPLTAYASNPKIEFVTEENTQDTGEQIIEQEPQEEQEEQPEEEVIVEEELVQESPSSEKEMQKLPSGSQGERDMANTPLTELDKYGNVIEVKEESGYVEEPEVAFFTVSDQVVNFNVKSPGKTTNYTEEGTGKKGYVYGGSGADAAFLGMENGKVKFMLSGVIGLVDEEEVQVVSTDNVKILSHYFVKNGNLYHKVARNLNEETQGSTINNGPAPSYLKSGKTYYSYDGHYFYTEENYTVMLRDYNAGHRDHSVNKDQPFYNYFQYLPLRSTTSYSGSALSKIINKKATGTSKMKDTGDIFINAQNTYGVNALLMAGIGANESAWGKSVISQNKNNLFGLNAVDSSPGQSANYFATVEQCIHEFAREWMSLGYLDPNDGRYNVGFLGNKASGANVKYASDPYWGEKAAAIAWALDSVSGNKDAKKYTIAIRNIVEPATFTVNIRNNSSKTGKKLYSSPKAANTAYLLRNTASANGFYQIQSDGVLNGQRTALESTTGQYRFKDMYAYISDEFLTVVNKGKAVPVDGPTKPIKPIEPEKPEEPQKPVEPQKPEKPDNSIVEKNGWVKEGGYTYYYVKNQKVTGEKKIDKKWYCFDADGKMITGWHQLPSKKVYYNENGQLHYGEKKIDGKWYLFEKVTGAMKTGFQKVPKKNKTVYYNEDGQMWHGEKKINGKWYWFDKVTGAMKCGFQKISGKNKTVYYNASGQMVYGERKINGKWYCFHKVTGAMIKNAKYMGHYYGANGVRVK